MRRSILFSFFLSILALFLVVGCDTRRDNDVDDRTEMMDDEMMDNTGTEMGTDADRDFLLFEDNKDYTYNEREQFKADVERTIDRLDERIDRLEDRADNVTDQEKEMYEARIKVLKEKRDNLEKQMDEFDNTNENNWEEFKSGVRTTWTDVKETWNKAIDELKYDEDEEMMHKDKTY